MNIIIVSCREWNRRLAAKIAEQGISVTYIADKDEVTAENFARLQPDWVFFPHWSYIIPREVYENYPCVIFHMTDLPFGRGGSPLQNLIARGIYETKITALKCSKTLDGGAVYLKKPLSLYGSAEEIYLRAGSIVGEMMLEIIANNPPPVEQTGEVVEFKRRKAADGDIKNLATLDKIYDYIRMLDADGYPKAFLDMGDFRLEFSRASLKDGKIIADVAITKREE